MRSPLQCLTEQSASDDASDESRREDPPCLTTVYAVLDVLELILKEHSKGGEKPLRLDDIQAVIAQLKQAPEHLQKLYDQGQSRCRAGSSAGGEAAEAADPQSSPETIAEDAPNKRGVGRLQTIGLHNVREKLGDRWETVAERVRSTALAVIKRCLAPNDTFHCTAEGDFIICFAELASEAAWLKAKMIEQEIRERLIGSDGDGALGDFQLDFDTLSGIAKLEAETHDLELPTTGNADENKVAALAWSKMEEASQGIRAKARDHLKALEEIWALDLRHVQVASGAPARLMIGEPDNQTRMVLERLKGAARRDPKLVASIDLLALGAAVDVLAGDEAAAGALLAIEIHASTVIRRDCYELFRTACQDIASEARDRLVLVVGDLPQDVYPPSLADTLRMLKGFSRVTALRLPASRLEGLDLRAAGVHLVFLAQTTASAMLSTAPKRFARFLDEVHRAGGRLLVDQVADEQAVVPLTEAGIELWSRAGIERPS